jgi:hypothetical protein
MFFGGSLEVNCVFAVEDGFDRAVSFISDIQPLCEDLDLLDEKLLIVVLLEFNLNL